MKIINSAIAVGLVLVGGAAYGQAGRTGSRYRPPIGAPTGIDTAPITGHRYRPDESNRADTVGSASMHPMQSPLIIESTGSRTVSASYLRMNEPDVLVNMAAAVRAGKIPESELDALAGHAIGKELMEGNGARRAGAASSPVLRHKHLGTRNSIGGFVPFYVGQLPEGDFGPTSIGCGDLADNEYVKYSFHVISPTDGIVTAHIGNDNVDGVTITKISTYTGEWRVQSASKTKIQRRMYPVLDKSVDGPGSIKVQAGQELVVDLKVGADHHTGIDANLEVIGENKAEIWKATSQISGEVARTESVVAKAVTWDRMVVVGQSVPVTFEISSVSDQPLTVTLSSASLPQGVTMEPVTVKVPAAPAPAVRAIVHLSVAADAPEALGVVVPVTVGCKGKTFANDATSAFTLNVYETIHEWTFPEQDRAFIQFSDPVVGIKQDGGWYMRGMAKDTGAVYGDTAVIGFTMGPGSDTKHAGYGATKFAAGETAAINYNGDSKWVADNYLGLVQTTPSIYIVDSQEGPSTSEILGVLQQVAGAVIPLL